jgi:hypothetical protein
MSRTRTIWCLCSMAIALAALAGISPITPAGAAPAGQISFVRAAHLSPDTPAVDVYLTAFKGGTTSLWLSDVGYGDMSTYRRIGAGVYVVSMRLHGAAAASPPALSWTINLKPGLAYTAAAMGKNSKIKTVFIKDTLAGPVAGTGLVRVVQASSQAGNVTVSTDSGRVVAGELGFGTTSGYVAVPAGEWTVEVKSRTDRTLSSRVKVSVGSESIISVLVLDARGGGLVVRPQLDAAGAANAPKGAVPAGGGGTARDPEPAAAATDLLAVISCAVCVLFGIALLRRRSGTVRS